MFQEIIRIGLATISSAYMFQFAFPKLMAKSVSVKSFTFFAEKLPVNAQFYMYFTGIVELTIALLLASSIFIRNAELQKTILVIGYGLLLATMVGALLTEFFVRPEPVPKLVKIAVALIVISLFQLIYTLKDFQLFSYSF